jgi:hypothetical protein
MNMATPHITIEQARAIWPMLAVQKHYNANLAIDKANAQQETYITAVQARELGASAEYYASAEDYWKTCAFLEVFPSAFEDGEVIKYRAIKQAQPEPVDKHAALRAEYATQVAEGTTEFYLWELKNSATNGWEKIFSTVGFYLHTEYRCTDISCMVSKDDEPAIRMLVMDAQKLQRWLGDTVKWFSPSGSEPGDSIIFDFYAKGTYAYRTKEKLVKLADVLK